MRYSQSAKELFTKWALEGKAASMERHHTPIVEALFATIPVRQGACLEIGVGSGYGIAHMAKHQFAHGPCYGVEIARPMVEIARHTCEGLLNVHLFEADFMTWEPPAGVRFETIFTMEVFYYFTSVEAALKRAHAMLTPGGELIVAVDYYTENPVSHSWPEELDTPMTLLSREEYRDLFARVGFRHITQTTIRDLPGAPRPPRDAGTLVTRATR